MSWAIAASIMENYITGTSHQRKSIAVTNATSAFQALVTIAHLKEGETVLIHTGASGQYLTQGM
jgi:NADPH:quinone reductase-like Zn-dependent oxidoreductase